MKRLHTSGPVAEAATIRLVYTNEAFELSEGKGGNKGESEIKIMLRDVLLLLLLLPLTLILIMNAATRALGQAESTL